MTSTYSDAAGCCQHTISAAVPALSYADIGDERHLSGLNSGTFRHHAIGSTYSFCGECLQNEEPIGLHVGETGVLAHSAAAKAPETLDADCYADCIIANCFEPVDYLDPSDSSWADSCYEECESACQGSSLDNALVSHDYSYTISATAPSSVLNSCLADFICDSQSIDDFSSYDSSGVSVCIYGGDAVEEELLRMAWYLMVRNDDIYKFALCRSEQYTDETFCLFSTYLNSDNLIIDVQWKHADHCPKYPICNNIMSGGLQIFLNTWTDRWQLMKSMWANPCTDSDKAYVAIEIAAWLFHELMHGVCRLGQAKEWRVNFAERAFRWGMYNRYWFALRDSQCFLDQFTDGGVTDELLLRSFVHNTWGDNSASCKPCDPDSSLDPSIDKTNEGKTDEFSLETDLDRMNSNELGGW